MPPIIQFLFLLPLIIVKLTYLSLLFAYNILQTDFYNSDH